MAETFDLEALVHLEQTCYDAGYTDGFAHGRIHGLIEGRALGREKGFEIWEEIGFYQGFAETWKAVATLPGRDDDARVLHHITHLLDLIRQFPTVNSSSSSSSSPIPSSQHETRLPPADDTDLPKLQRQISSRYKALCASLGIRPTLRAQATSTDEEPTQTLDSDHHRQGHKGTTRPDVWTLTRTRGQADVPSRRIPTVQGLSF